MGTEWISSYALERINSSAVLTGWGVIVAPEVDHACPHGDDERPDRRPAPLEATRRAHADQRSHEQAQVEGARVDEQSFEDVGVPAQMRPPPNVTATRPIPVSDSRVQEWDTDPHRPAIEQRQEAALNRGATRNRLEL